MIAVYAAPLFLALFMVASILRIRQDGTLVAMRRIAAFVLPVLLLGGALTVLRWQDLYSYYFVWGYDYGTPVETAQRILVQTTNESGLSLPVIIAAALLGLVSAWRTVHAKGALVAAVWFVVALPVEIVLIGQFYHSFYVLWSPLLLALLAVLLSRPLHRTDTADSMSPIRSFDARPTFGAALILISFGAALLAQQSVTAQAHSMATQLAPLGHTYRAVAHHMADAPPNTRVALLFDLVSAPLMNHIIFDYGHKPIPIVQVYNHDQYYRAEYGNTATADQIVQVLSGRLNSGDITLGFAFDNPHSVERIPYISRETEPISHQVIADLSDYMCSSTRWHATGRIASPYGDIVIYTYSATK